MQNWDYLYLEYAEHDIFEDDSLHCRHHVVYEIRIGGSGGKIIDFSIGIQILWQELRSDKPSGRNKV